MRANATLDFDRVEIRKEDYGDKTTRSQQVREESSTTQGGAAAGIPGTSSNIPGYEQVLPAQGPSQSQKTEKITNYEVDKEETRRIVAPGNVKQLSVSVVLDRQLDPQEQQELEQMVAAAAGVRPERGDTVTLTGMPFDTSWARRLEAEMAAARRRSQAVALGLAAAGAVALFFLGRWLLQNLRRLREERPVPTPEAALEEIAATRELQLTPEEKERAWLLEQIQRLVRQSPKEAAYLLRTWLSEESR